LARGKAEKRESIFGELSLQFDFTREINALPLSEPLNPPLIGRVLRGGKVTSSFETRGGPDPEGRLQLAKEYCASL
jgi:hypothetical protein